MNLLKKALSKANLPLETPFFFTLILQAFAWKGKPGAEVSDMVDKDSMAAAKPLLMPGEPVSAE